MGKIKNQSKITLTESIKQKLDDSIPVDASCAYNPVESKENNEFLNLIGEDAYFNSDETTLKTDKKKIRKGKTKDYINLVIGIIALVGFILFLLLIYYNF